MDGKHVPVSVGRVNTVLNGVENILLFRRFNVNLRSEA